MRWIRRKVCAARGQSMQLQGRERPGIPASGTLFPEVPKSKIWDGSALQRCNVKDSPRSRAATRGAARHRGRLAGADESADELAFHLSSQRAKHRDPDPKGRPAHPRCRKPALPRYRSCRNRLWQVSPHLTKRKKSHVSAVEDRIVKIRASTGNEQQNRLVGAIA